MIRRIMLTCLALTAALAVCLIGCSSAAPRARAGDAGADAAAAAARQWDHVGLGGGGGIFTPASSPHDPRLMFCASDMSGVYRSADGGRNWRMLHWRHLSSALTSPVIFHPTDPKVMYCTPGPWGRPVLKVSRDGGLSWRALCDEMPWQHAAPQATLPAIGPAGKVLLVSSDAGTFRSDNEGRSWRRAAGIDKKVVAFFLPAAGPWYAGTPDGALASTDRGRTWRLAANRGLTGPVVSFCGGADAKRGRVALYAAVETQAVDGKLTGGIFRSDDGGATWASAMGDGLNTSVGARDGSRREIPAYPAVAMAENQTDTVYAYCYGNGARPPRHDTVYRTDDGGKTWRATVYGRPNMKGHNVELSWIGLDRGTGGRTLGFAVNARDSNVVAWTDMMRIFMTDNGGKTWRQAFSRCVEGAPAPGKRWESVGLEMTTTWRYLFDPHDPKRVYICYTDIGFARSTDRGRTWYWAARGSPWTNTFYDLAFDPDVPGRIWAACAYEHDIPAWKMSQRVYGGGGVCLSEDCAKTWRPVATGLPAVGACTAVVVDPKSPKDRRTLYCTIYGGGVFKSTDHARTWKPVNKGLNVKVNDHFTDLKRHKDGTLLALCGGKKLGRYRPVAVNGLYKSTDGGASWTHLTAKVPMYLPYGFDVHPTDSRIIYLAVAAVPQKHDEAGVYKSTDGGTTWTKLSVPWPAGGPSWVHCKYPCIDPNDPNRVWLSTGTHGLMVTPDAGKTWRRVEGLPFRGASRVHVDPADAKTIWVTTFGGGVWRGPADAK